MFQQVQEKTLYRLLSVIRRMSAEPSEEVERIPIKSAQLAQSGLPPLGLALHRLHDDRPVGAMRTYRALRWRTMVAFHKELRV